MHEINLCKNVHYKTLKILEKKKKKNQQKYRINNFNCISYNIHIIL